MRFSKSTLSLRWGLFALLILLSACSNMGKKKGGDKDALPEGEQAPFVLIPNPYQPGPVPEPAKREYAAIKQAMTEEKWVQAKGLLNLMIETYPKLSGPYINLGIAHHALGEVEQSEKAFRFAIETNPQNFDAYPRLGLLLREQGRFEDAEAVYLQALSLWPHHLASAKNLGILYDLYMGRFDDALVYYKLSQNIAGGEDRQLKGWIIDLERRMADQ